MGMMDQMKMAQQMMQHMSPEEIKQLMEQAKEHQKELAGQIKKIVDEEIKQRDLLSREEVEKIIADKLK